MYQKTITLHILILTILFSLIGCSPIKPTYTRENFASSIKKICEEEYGIDNVKVWLIDNSAWIYAPQDKLLNKNMELDEEVAKKFNNIRLSTYRVLLSMKRRPQFYIIILSDIKETGTDLMYLGYVEDIAKLQHIPRSELNSHIYYTVISNPSALSDIQGAHIIPYDINMEQFLSLLITQKAVERFPENNFTIKELECFFTKDAFNLRYDIKEKQPGKAVDIKKELLKITFNIFKSYKFTNYVVIQINDSGSSDKTILSRTAFEEYLSPIKNQPAFGN